MGYLPGDKLSINCTAAPSHPGASLTWLVNRRKVDRWVVVSCEIQIRIQIQIQIHRWMVTNYLPVTYPSGLTSSVLGLSFLVLAEHFRGPERELWATCRLELQIQIQIQIQFLQGHNASYQGRGDACGAQPAPWWSQPPWQPPGQLSSAQRSRQWSPWQCSKTSHHHPSADEAPLIMMPNRTGVIYISLSAINFLHTMIT